jgi:uncharacterized delta-60 repeat protein
MAAGDLDTTFDVDGKVTTGFGVGASDYASSVALQADGRIVAAGRANNGTDDDFALARYNANGGLDGTFGSGGKITTPFGSSHDRANGVAVQADGRIVVAGDTDVGMSLADFAIARYTSAGVLDTSFDSDGKATTDFGGGVDRGYAVAIQNDGKIIVAGRSDADFGMVRYNSDGSLDSSFDLDGRVTTSFGGSEAMALSVALQSDGTIILAGYTIDSGSYKVAVARYTSTGALDSTFDGDGKVITTVVDGGTFATARAVAVQSDGKIVVAGNNWNGSNYDFATVRYNSDGSLDTSFDTDGKVTTDIGGSNDNAYGLAIQQDGKLVVVGNSSVSSVIQAAVVRYLSDGNLDTAFSGDGKLTTTIGLADSAAMSVVLQPDHKIVVAGGTNVGGGDYDFALARYDAGIVGTLSPTLSTGILTITDIDVVGNTNNLTVSDDGAGKVVITSDTEVFTGTGGITGATLSNDEKTLKVPFTAFSSIVVNSAGGNDSLTVNLVAGDPVPNNGITFNGGGQIGTPGDTLAIVGGVQGNVTYNYSSAHNGSITLQNYGTISYTGLEPITNSGTSTNVVFNLSGANDEAKLSDIGSSTLRLQSTSATPTFETTDFAKPSGTITINGDQSTALLSLLGNFDFSNTAGELDVNPNGDLVYISAGMGQSGLIRVDASNPAAMNSTTLSFGGGVAVDPVSGRYATTNGSTTLKVFNADGSEYDSKSLSGCGGSLAAGNNTFGISTQCSDHFAIYRQVPKTLTNVASGGVGSRVVYNAATSQYFWRRDGFGTLVFSEATGVSVTTIGGRYIADAMPGSFNRVYVTDTNFSHLYVLDGNSFAVTATITMPIGDLAVDTVNDRLYFVSGSTIQIYNGAGTTPLGTFTLPGGFTPGLIDMAIDDDRLYVLSGKESVNRLFVLQAGSTPGNDVLTLDLTSGDPLANGLTFSGSGGTDALSILGSGGQNPTYSPNATTANSGGIAIGTKAVAFDTAESVELLQVGTVTVSTLNTADTLTVANDLLGDGVTAALSVSGTSGAIAITKALVRGSGLVINTTATDGNDSVTVTSANNAHTNTSLSINTGTGTDTMAVTGAVAMSGSISLSSPTIRLGADLSTNVSAAAGSLSLTGAVTLTATTNLTTDGTGSDGAIQITGALNGGFGATFAAGGGNVSVSDAIGGSTALSSLAVSSAGNATFSSTIQTTGSVTQSTGSGTTSFNGTSGSGIGGNLSVNTNAIDFSTAASTVVGTTSLTALNGITFNANARLNATGTVAIVANNDNTGVQGFLQDSTAAIQTANTGSSALSLTVRGFGGAFLGALQTGAGGRATVTVGSDISDNNGVSTNITAAQTALTAVSGIGNSDELETAVSTLAALNTSSNAISIANSVGSLLTVGTVGSLIGVRNNGTHIAIVNGSPFTIADDVVATGNVTLTATDSASPGDNLVVNNTDTLGTGTVEITAGGAALLRAGDDLTLNISATVTAVGSATFVGDYNSDAGETATTTIQLDGSVVVTTGTPTIVVTAGAGNDTVTLSGTYTATGGSVQVSTGNGADTVTLNTNNSGDFATMTVNGGLGNDQITMTNLPNAITSGQVVTLSGGGGADTLTGQSGVNAFVVNGSDAGTLNHVNSSGSNTTNPAIKFDTIENLVAGPLADSFLMETDGSLGGSIDGGAGVDLLSYVNRSDAVTVNLLLGTATPTPTSIAGGIAMAAVNNSTIENLTGGSGADSLTGDIDDNAIIGNGGADTINAKAGTDSVNGGAGSDIINIEGSEAEYDTMIGGTGLAGDTNDYDSLINIGGATVTLNAFNFTFDSFANSIDLYDGNNQSLQGNGGSNTLQFGFTRVINVPGPTRTVSGTVGDDTMTTAYDNSVATTYDGSTHAVGDTVFIVLTPRQFDYLTDTQITNLNAYLAAPTGQSLTLSVDVPDGEIDLNVTVMNFEAARVAVFDDGLILDITTCFSNIRAAAQIITGSDDPAVSDTIDGTALTDLIFGQRGNDTIRGLAGNDCVFGGAGADMLLGQDGDDLLAGGSGNDALYGGVNNDRLLGASGDDSLFGEAGDDQLDGGAGNDMADGGADNDLVVGNTGNDSLFGDLGFDILQGGEGIDYLSGGLHDDVLNGGLGDDTILGGDGFDTIQVAGWEAVNDVMLGGANTDTVATVGTTAVVLNNFNASASSIEVWSGGGYAIFGTTGNNVLDFSGLTFSAVPFVDGSSGDDRITGTGGPDELRGGDGNDTLIGLGGVDILRGYAGNDSLNGGSGIDYLFGGFGEDTLTAGDGRDIYYFAYDDALTDTVTDFEQYSDTLSFRDYRPTYTWTYSSLAFATVVAGTRDVILPTMAQLGSNKRIRLLGRTTNVASTQVRFT